MMKILIPGLILLSLAGCTTELVTEPSDPERASEINAQLGLGYMQSHQYKRSMTKLDKAIKFNPDNANAYHYKAELLRRLGENERAQKFYEKALDIDPDNANALNNYGVFLCGRGQYEQAYKHFDKILNDPLYQYKADAYENVGLCAYRQGKLKKAEDAFLKAISINKKMSKSILKLAQLSYDRRNRADAYSYFKRYLSLSGHTAESLWLGILLERGRGNKNTVASYKVLLKGKFPASKETKLLRKLEAQGKI